MKKILLNALATVILGSSAIAQNVNIPDANFKAYLLGVSTINTNSDSEIQVSEAAAFTGGILCNGYGISDLSGIENFINLTVLNVQNNQLTSLDVSQNTALVALNCAQNNLNGLNLNQNTLLEELYCNQNNLSVLDISQLTNLISFNCSQNNISALDFSQNTGINQNTGLTISYINCQQNNLTILNMTNISTTMLDNPYFNATSNPNLTCIQVDDVTDATTTWTNIDPTASFSLNCSSLGLSEELNKEHVEVYPNPTSGLIHLNLDSPQKVVGLSIANMLGQKRELNLMESMTYQIEGESGFYVVEVTFENGEQSKLPLLKN